MRSLILSPRLVVFGVLLFILSTIIRVEAAARDLTSFLSLVGTQGPSVPLALNSAFTPGNIVVCRVGDGGGVLGNGATAVFLDEYTPAGVKVQSIAMPTAASGSNLILTASGTATTECEITRSADGRFILISGYNAPIPTASVSSSGVERVLGRVSSAGVVDTTTSTTSLTQTIRSVASDNGSNFWAVGDANGVFYKSFGTNGAGTRVSNTITNNRVINIFDGQLYTSDNSGSAVRLGKVGTGLPTTTGQTITNLPGFPTSGSPNGFYFTDLSPTVAGLDTLYVASDATAASPPTSTSGGVQKFSLVSGSWVYNGTFPASTTPSIPVTGFVGLAGSTNGGTVTLFATRSGIQLVSLVDATGYNAAPTAVPTLVAEPDLSNTAFRGVALAPVATPKLSIDDVTKVEGNSGTSTFTFTVSLDTVAGPGGVTFEIATADGTATSASDYVARSLTGQTIPAGSNSYTFDVTVNGDTSSEPDETFLVNVTNVSGADINDGQGQGTITNDDAAAPTATNLSAGETYTEDTPLNLIDIVVTDPDSSSVTATLTLSNTAAGSLTTATSGTTTSTYNSGTGVWTASGPISEVNALLAGVSFVPAANFNSSFTIATSVTDGATTPATGTKAMTGTPVNDAPTATNLSAGETYTEDTALNLIDIVVSDVDSSSVTATLTLSNPSAGSLSTGTSGPVTSTYVGATGVWTASGPIANVNALLAGVTFTPALNFNSSFSIATSVSDGVAPAVTGSKAMTGTAVNDAPTATNLSAAETYTEDTTLDLIDIVVSDVDSSSVTVTLTLSAAAAGSLTTGTSGPVTSTYTPATGVWTAAGPVANVNALLAGVSFSPTANFDSSFSIATSVSDGAAPAITGNKNMSGVAVNDAPVLDPSRSPALGSQVQDSGPPAGAVGTLVSGLVDFASPSGQLDNVADPDSGALLGIAVIDADTSNGSWFYTTDGGSSWQPLGTVSDSGARLLAANAGTRLYFEPAAGFFGQASVTFRAWDQTAGLNGSLQSATPNGGSTAFSSASDTASITITPVVTNVQFSSAAYSGPEGFSATVTVTRTGDLTGASTVEWSTSGAGGGTCGTVGADYESGSGTLSFGAGEDSKTFSVLLCTDADRDSGESVTLMLTNPQGATLGGMSSASLQVLDAASQFTNMQSISVPASGSSSPYGTTIDVSGVTLIGSIRLTLFGVTYSNLDDLDVLLVGPQGQTYVPMADAGGTGSIVNGTITFDELAAAQLPDDGPIVLGQNYRPAVCTVANGGAVSSFADGAPAGPYNQPGCTSDGSTFSSVFANQDPTGTWTLYVRGDNGDPVMAGSVAGGTISGWGMQIFSPTAADVAVSGRVRTPEGVGIRGAMVTIAGGHLDKPRSVLTNSFGYYKLENVPAGATYVITVQSRRYGFAQPSRAISVQDSVSNVDFVSGP